MVEAAAVCDSGLVQRVWSWSRAGREKALRTCTYPGVDPAKEGRARKVISLAQGLAGKVSWGHLARTS